MTGNSWAERVSDKLVAWQRDKGAVDKLITVPAADLNGKHVALLFSAHWCPPCRKFTPLLASVYDKLHQQGRAFEVVFVSMDKTKEDFQDYFGSMPWLAVSYEEDTTRTALRRTYGVDGIPHVVMLGPDGKVLCSNARGAIMADPAAAKFPWASGKSNRRSVVMLAIAALVLFVVVAHFLLRSTKAQ